MGEDNLLLYILRTDLVPDALIFSFGVFIGYAIRYTQSKWRREARKQRHRDRQGGRHSDDADPAQ
jgi:hypothetical protein